MRIEPVKITGNCATMPRRIGGRLRAIAAGKRRNHPRSGFCPQPGFCLVDLTALPVRLLRPYKAGIAPQRTSALPGRPRAVEGRSTLTNVDRCRQLGSRSGR